MSSSQRNRSTSHPLRACTECQKRKSKCTGVNPCSFCQKSGKVCVFQRPPVRTPLTRKNLDEAERQCMTLKSLLRSLNPDVDIQALIEGRPKDGENSPTSTSEGRTSSPIPEDGYEWHETPLSPIPQAYHPVLPTGDGMASLSTKPHESGYLGSSSGSSLLQTISQLLSHDGNTAFEESTERLSLKSTSPSHRYLHAKYTPSGNLATSAITERLIEAYFLLYNTSYPILNEWNFRGTYQRRAQLPANSSWHLIFYMVLAIGHWTSCTSGEPEDSPYYAAARSRMSISLLESGTLPTVQAFLLMGNYLQKRDRPNTGYNFLGIAYRMALGLGLHREIPLGSGQEDTLARETRRVIWWILYCFDSGFSITTGRPTAASSAVIDVRMPRNIDDSACAMNSVLPAPVQYPTTYSAIIAQTQLAVIANQIHNELLSAHTNNSEADQQLAPKMEEHLFAWRISLPVYFTDGNVPEWFKGPRSVVLWKEQNLRMMLWRGGQRSSHVSPDKAEAASRCQAVAVETVQDISSFCKLQELHLGLNWYATYFLFQATLVLELALLQSPKLVPVEYPVPNLLTKAISEARSCFSQLGNINAAAKQCVSVLDRIHNHLALSPSKRAQTIEGATSSFDLRPNNVVTDEHVENRWSHWAADPTLHMFLEETPMANFFEGLEGFPATHEQEFFDYVSGNFYNTEAGNSDNLRDWTNMNFDMR